MHKLSSHIHEWCIDLLSDASLDVQDAALEALYALEQGIEHEPDLRHILMNVALPVEERMGLIKRILPSAPASVIELLRRMLQGNALDALPLFIHHAAQIRERFGVAREVEVMSAVPLLPKEREELQKTLEKSWNTHVILHEHVDPGVIGGLRLRSDGWFFDATVHGRTERLARNLIAA